MPPNEITATWRSSRRPRPRPCRRLVHRQPGAIAAAIGSFDDLNAAGTRPVPGFLHRALLHASNPPGTATTSRGLVSEAPTVVSRSTGMTGPQSTLSPS